MATVLFAWEAGGGLGHVMQMRPLAADLSAAGHRVVLALRDLAGAAELFPAAAGLLQAPHLSDLSGRPYRTTQNYAHLLANMGWHDPRLLATLAVAWRNLMGLVHPDLIVFDYAPTAMLACRGLPNRPRRVLIGSGFCCPPDASPFPPLVPQPDIEQLRRDEARLLDHANRLLQHWRAPPLARLGQLYSEVDENFLTTFAELEQYPSRTGVRYWGPVPSAGGDAPRWPAGEGRRVFAYLKAFPATSDLLTRLRDLGNPVIVYIDGATEAARRRFESPSLRLARERPDLDAIARGCEVAILNAGQGATAAMLLAGRPLLQIPLSQEQRLTARAARRLGAAEVASPKDAPMVLRKLDLLLGPDYAAYAGAAARFAARHHAFDGAARRQDMCRRVNELLTSPSRLLSRRCETAGPADCRSH